MNVGFIIVCQGALTIRQCIDHHAPMFDKLIVVEGASLAIPKENGSGLRMTGGSPNSTDGTLRILDEAKPRHKNLVVIKAKEPWQGKTAQCEAALVWLREQGVKECWLMQIDADEFWWPKHVRFLQTCLPATEYTDCDFWMRHFWPTIEYHTRLEPGVWGNQPPWRRVFRWRGELWISHEPPLLDGKRVVLGRDATRAMGVIPFHYGYVHESQFRGREVFYNLPDGALVNERNSFLSKLPDSPHGKLVRYEGPHPIDVGFLK